MEQIEGIIQRIKSDRKALAIESEWFNSFKPLDSSIQVGQEVKLVYSTKGQFKNIKSIEQIKNETKELPQKNRLNNELTTTDKNCILMTAKDLAIEFKSIPFKNWIKEVKDIRLSL